MKPKKTKKADLNNYSTTFMLLGLVVVLFISLQIINSKIFSTSTNIGKLNLTDIDDDETFVFKLEEPKPITPKQFKKELIEPKIIKDDSKIKEDFLKTSEVKDTDTIPDISEVKAPLIEEPEISFPIYRVENAPVYPGCEGKKGEDLKACLSKKIGKFVGNKFNTEIAQDMGLSGEKVKIMTSFAIDKTGKVTNIQTRSKYKDLEKEAKRVLASLPVMKPGNQNGRNVKVIYTLPIVFKVAEE